MDTLALLAGAIVLALLLASAVYYLRYKWLTKRLN